MMARNTIRKVRKKAAVQSSEVVSFRKLLKLSTVIRRLFWQSFISLAARADWEAIENALTLYAEILADERKLRRHLSELKKPKVVH